METAIEELKKVQKVLSILDFSENEIEENINKLNNLIFTHVAAEMLAKKGYKSTDGEFNNEEVKKFLEENYSEKEIIEISRKIGNEIITGYFRKILKNISAEKLSEVEDMVNAR